MHTTEGIYAILDTESGKFISFGTKCGWEKAGSAKLAFSLHTTTWQKGRKTTNPLDEQSRYAVVELTEYYFKSKENA